MSGLRTHECPGRCGRIVADARYACVPCWTRLPQTHRNAVMSTVDLGTADPRRRKALTDAGAWFKANP